MQGIYTYKEGLKDWRIEMLNSGNGLDVIQCNRITDFTTLWTLWTYPSFLESYGAGGVFCGKGIVRDQYYSSVVPVILFNKV
jgi:hypothetical protein